MPGCCGVGKPTQDVLLQKGSSHPQLGRLRVKHTHPSHGIPLRALTRHQVEAFLLLGVGPHLAGEEVQLDGGDGLSAGREDGGRLKDRERSGRASPSAYPRCQRRWDNHHSQMVPFGISKRVGPSGTFCRRTGLRDSPESQPLSPLQFAASTARGQHTPPNPLQPLWSCLEPQRSSRCSSQTHHPLPVTPIKHGGHHLVCRVPARTEF